MPTWTKSDLLAYEQRQNRRAAQSSEPQSPVFHESVATETRENGHTGLIQVSVVSFRKRLCDVDNLCPKYFVDCLRYAEIIPDDAPQFIDLKISQIKVKTCKQERTEITITKP